MTNYCKRLGVVPPDFAPNYSNEFLSWAPAPEVADPAANQIAVARTQTEVRERGGVLSRAPKAATAVAVGA